MPLSLPLLLEPATLHTLLQQGLPPGQDLLIVDLCSEASYLSGHIPGAIHVPTAELIRGEKPAVGQLPTAEKLKALFSRIGLTPQTHVVCYDDEGGPWAGRFIWTLDVIGHAHYSFLDGGICSWRALCYAEEKAIRQRHASSIDINLHNTPIANTEDILARLGDKQLLVWDARSPEEYRGEKILSQKGGHIPGAVHCEWTRLLDPNRHLRIREDAGAYLQSMGITPDKDIVTHCQTHRRSGLTYVVAKILGYPSVRAYPGSWAEWGNRNDTPIETQGETS